MCITGVRCYVTDTIGWVDGSDDVDPGGGGRDSPRGAGGEGDRPLSGPMPTAAAVLSAECARRGRRRIRARSQGRTPTPNTPLSEEGYPARSRISTCLEYWALRTRPITDSSVAEAFPVPHSHRDQQIAESPATMTNPTVRCGSDKPNKSARTHLVLINTT